jgi:hypothetical protein
MAVKTIEARVLLGWMPQDQAIRYLREECYFDPDISAKAAEELWQTYKAIVDGLPPRTPADPHRFPLSQSEKISVNQFRRMYNFDPNIADVIKLDPMGLLVHQLYVVTEISDGYAESVKGDGWINMALLARRQSQFRWRIEAGKIIYEFPHGEFMMSGPQAPDGHLNIMEGGRLANAAQLEGRMLLGTGYHRTFAYSRSAMNAPDGIGKAVVFPLLRNLPFPDSPAMPNHGLRAMLLGARPPFFADFFDNRLFMPVMLRKKKCYELRIHAELVGVNDES